MKELTEEMTKEEILKLDGEEAEKLCDELGLPTSGMDNTLRKRLISYYKEVALKGDDSSTKLKINSATKIAWPIGYEGGGDYIIRSISYDNETSRVCVYFDSEVVWSIPHDTFLGHFDDLIEDDYDH